MPEPSSVRPIMLPPPGFVEQAVERGLAHALAAEALEAIASEVVAATLDATPAPHNDVRPARPRKRRDSGIIAGISIDDTPTLPFIRAAAK